MTRDRDIERVLDRFYAEGPSEMPDRVYLGIFDRIERVPQRGLASQMTRFATMNTNSRLAAAAAIVVALVGIGAYAFSQRPTVGPNSTPSPTPTASAAASFAQASLPIALRGNWVGVPRVVPQLPEPPYRLALQLTDVQLAFQLASEPQKEFASIAALTAPDTILVVGASTDGGCRPGDEGTYSFRLDASGTGLTLAPVSDACAPRAAALTGGWTHAACQDVNSWCLGDLAPGAHVSTIFTPFVDPAKWVYSYGRFSYSVLDGWRNTVDCAGCYELHRRSDPADAGVYVFADVVAHADYGTACQDDIAKGVGRSASAIATYLSTRPGIVSTKPAPITLGGLSGVTIDISVAPGWTPTCPFSNGRPIVATFTDADPATGGFDWNIAGEGRTRIILLDLPDGRALLVDIEAQTKATYEALLPDAMQVVNTFKFSH